MAAKKKSRFDNKFKSTAASDSRTANVRTERKVKDDLPKLSFNFKDFDFNQCPPGQTLEKWQESNMLDKLLRLESLLMFVHVLDLKLNRKSF